MLSKIKFIERNSLTSVRSKIFPAKFHHFGEPQLTICVFQRLKINVLLKSQKSKKSQICILLLVHEEHVFCNNVDHK